jgi:hypothetical protein
VESSLDRYPYQEVAAAELNWTMTKRSKNKILWRTRYNYSIPERGSWLSSQVEVSRRQWSWNLGFDILGADVDPQSSEAGLFSRYGANDRVTGGVNYVF